MKERVEKPPWPWCPINKVKFGLAALPYGCGAPRFALTLEAKMAVPLKI